MTGIKKTENLVRARKRKVFFRRLWTAFRVVLILVLFTAVLWGLNYFYNSNYFKIKEIEVEGNTHYDDEYINELLSGLIGENIFEADKKNTEDALMEDLVWIRSAEFKKIFPDRIIIIIQERKPFLLIRYRNKHYLLDREGMVLEDVGDNIPDEYKGLLQVSGAIDHSIEPGNVLAKKNILSCAEIYMGFDDDLKTIIKDAGIKDNISGDIFFNTFSGLEIIFGDSSQVIKKIEVLKLLLKEGADYTIIDLKSPDNPVVKY